MICGVDEPMNSNLPQISETKSRTEVSQNLRHPRPTAYYCLGNDGTGHLSSIGIYFGSSDRGFLHVIRTGPKGSLEIMPLRARESRPREALGRRAEDKAHAGAGEEHWANLMRPWSATGPVHVWRVIS